MPHKDPEARKAYARARYAKLKAENPEWIARRKERLAQDFQRRKDQDNRYLQKRRQDFKRWYDLNGKQSTRIRKGYKPWDEYVAELAAKRKAHNEYMKQWYSTEKGKRAQLDRNLKQSHGISVEQYDAVYDAQAGNCRICGIHKERYTKDRLYVDHCHERGVFRALLCGRCNSAIGLLGESEMVLQSAIEYLRSFTPERGT